MRYQPVGTAVIGCGMISDIYMKNCREKFSVLRLTGCADLADEKARA